MSQSASLDAHTVWASPDGDGHVHYACYCEGEWTKPEIIHESTDLSLAPTVLDTAEGLVAFWVDLRPNSFKQPFFAHRIDGEWSAAIALDTQIRSTASLSAIVDNDGQLWLTWSGNDWDLTGEAQTSDIYAGRFEGGSLLDIKRIHEENSVSDLMPRIAIDTLSAKPVINWFEIDPQELKTHTVILTSWGWQPLGSQSIEADFNTSAFSGNIDTGLVSLDALDLPLPDFIRPSRDQVAVLFSD